MRWLLITVVFVVGMVVLLMVSGYLGRRWPSVPGGAWLFFLVAAGIVAISWPPGPIDVIALPLVAAGVVRIAIVRQARE